MAKGFFDIVDQYNKSGYGAFQSRQYTPQELAEMYAMSQARGVGGGLTLHERLGKNAAGFLGGLGWVGYNLLSPKAKAARKEEARQDRVNMEVVNDIKKRAQGLAGGEGLADGEAAPDPVSAVERASAEAFGTRYPQAGKYDTANRETALRVYMETQRLKEEEPNRPGTKKVEFIGPNGQRGWFDLKLETPPPGWRPVDESVQTNSVTDPSDPDYEFQVERDRYGEGWVLSTGPDGQPIRRRTRGTNISFSNDAFGLRTEAQAGQAYETGLNHIAAYANANKILKEIQGLAETLPWSPDNLVGRLSVTAEKVKGIGEFLNGAFGPGAVDQAFYEITDTEGNVTGRQSYTQLTNPNKYKHIFESESFKPIFDKMAAAGATTQRIKASLIELAYMIAVAEEPSARGISDNDIERRLMTLGHGAGTKDTFQAMLSDAQRRLALKFETRLDLDPIYRATGADGVTLYDKGRRLLREYDPGPMSVPTLDAPPARPGRKNPLIDKPVDYRE